MNITSIGIIGYGQFGQFIEMLVRKHCPEIHIKISSQSHEADQKVFYEFEEVCKTDLIFLCVPIDSYQTIIQKVIPHMNPEGIIVDIATIKAHTQEILSQYTSKVKYICTHPMFGPNSYKKLGNALTGLRMIWCGGNIEEEYEREIIQFLERQDLKVLKMSADEHDRKLAGTLFLNHLVAQSILRTGYTRTDVDPPSFDFLMNAVESVQYDSALFTSVYKYNPYCKEVVDKFLNCTQEVKDMLQL